MAPSTTVSTTAATTGLATTTGRTTGLRFATRQDDLYLSVEREPAARLRPTVTERMQRRIDRHLADGELLAGCVFTGTGGRNVAVLGQLAPGGRLARQARDRYSLEVVDHVDGATTMDVDPGAGLFHFINEFAVAPGRRDQMVEYFTHTIPAVRVQPGYVATNLLVSRDGRRAVNVGQYETRADFVAIFRQREVIDAFREGPSYKAMARIGGLLPRIPRLRLYGVPTPVQAVTGLPSAAGPGREG